LIFLPSPLVPDLFLITTSTSNYIKLTEPGGYILLYYNITSSKYSYKAARRLNMTILYTSELEIPSDNLVSLIINQITLDPNIKVEVNKWSSSDEYIEDIIPRMSYIENNIENKTHIRVYLSEGQVLSGEKIKINLVR